MEGLDSFQRAFWGDFNTTGFLPDGAAQNMGKLVGPLVAVRDSFGKFVHAKEAASWAAVSSRLDYAASVYAGTELANLSESERATLAAGSILHGYSLDASPDGLPVVTLIFSLIRASRAEWKSESWWLDVLNAFADVADEIFSAARDWAAEKATDIAATISGPFKVIGLAVGAASALGLMAYLLLSDD